MEFFGGILETQRWPGYNNQRKNHIYSTKSMSYVMMTNIKVCNLSAKQLSVDIRYRAWWKLMSWLANLLIFQQCKKFKSSRFQSLLLYMPHAKITLFFCGCSWRILYLVNCPTSSRHGVNGTLRTNLHPEERLQRRQIWLYMKWAQWASTNRLSTETPDSAFQNVPAIIS